MYRAVNPFGQKEIRVVINEHSQPASWSTAHTSFRTRAQVPRSSWRWIRCIGCRLVSTMNRAQNRPHATFRTAYTRYALPMPKALSIAGNVSPTARFATQFRLMATELTCVIAAPHETAWHQLRSLIVTPVFNACCCGIALKGPTATDSMQDMRICCSHVSLLYLWAGIAPSL